MSETIHQGLPVDGYRPQNEVNVGIVNRNKCNEERQLRYLEHDLASNGADPRWIAVARTHLEQAFMAWNRAIFKPGRVTLPEDGQGSDTGAAAGGEAPYTPPPKHGKRKAAGVGRRVEPRS